MKTEQKKKAQELVFKLIDNTNYPYKKATFEQSRMCALICVDEVIQACEYNNVETYNTDWWLKVKEEIQNL